MRRFTCVVFAAIVTCCLGGWAQADDNKDAKPVIDKALKALGGADKLTKEQTTTWSSKGKISIGGDDNEFTSKMASQGLDHFRQEFEGTFGGNAVKAVTVLAGDKGWMHFGDQSGEMEGEALANQKRVVYLQAVAATVVPLLKETFKIESVTDDKVGDKPATALKVKGPDGKDFQIWFDKESGLPVKEVAAVTGFGGEEYTQETTYSNYKDFGGIKRATKIESKRDGEKFIEQELVDFKTVEKPDPGTFAQP